MKKTLIIASAFIALVSSAQADVKHHAKKAETAQKEPKELPAHPDKYDEMITKQAKRHGVPESLVHRVIVRESKYRPTAMNRIYFGLMQITYATARSMGYKGAPKGLLDAETNLTYAVPYLANAYIVAGKNEDRAVALYAAGYYFEARRQHKLDLLRTASSEPVVPEPVVVAQEAPPVNPVSLLFHAFTGTPDLTPATANPAPTSAETAAAPTQAPAAQTQASQAAQAQAQQAVASAETAPATQAAASADAQQVADASAETAPVTAPEKSKAVTKKSSAKTAKAKTPTEKTVAEKTVADKTSADKPATAKTTVAKADPVKAPAIKKVAAKKTVLAAVKPASNAASGAPAPSSNNGNATAAEADLRH